MTVRGKVLLFLAVALGLVAMQGASLYQGTARGQLAREWSIRANEQHLLYTQFRGDALLYLDALHQARQKGQTAAVLAQQQRRLKEQFLQLRILSEGEIRWASGARPSEPPLAPQLEQALHLWTEQTEARLHGLPARSDPEDVQQQASLEAYQREVEPFLARILEEERNELEALSQQGEHFLRIGHLMSIIIPVTALGLMLTLAAAILIPMHQRFQELLAGAERIGRGEFGQDLTDKGRDEFSRLAHSFNQMNRQLQATQARLIFADRMATVGRLSAGVGHEINNPLTYVLNNLHYAHQELSQPQGVTSDEDRQNVLEALNEAKEGAERVRFIVQDLKMLSRADDASTSRVDLAAVVRGAARMASHEIATRARLVEDCGHVPAVLGNPARLGQVFLNLLVNSAQAMPEGSGRNNEIRVVARQEDAEHVIVDVSDTGCGIPPENLERIFDPFFTTKPAGQGTGLGLSVCHDIITSHGGRITVESQPSHGTTFHITLPVARNAGAA